MTTSEALLPGSAAARRTRLNQTTGYYLAFVTLGLISASLGATLPGLTEQTSSSFSQISYLFTARSFGYLTGSFSGGRFYDRFVGNRVMVLALTVIGLSMFTVPRIAWLPALIVLVFIIGFSQGSVDVGGNTLILWVHGAAVGPYMNGLHFFWGDRRVPVADHRRLGHRAIRRDRAGLRRAGAARHPAHHLAAARAPAPPGHRNGPHRTRAIRRVLRAGGSRAHLHGLRLPLRRRGGVLRRLDLHLRADSGAGRREDRGLSDFGLLGRADGGSPPEHPARRARFRPVDPPRRRAAGRCCWRSPRCSSGAIPRSSSGPGPSPPGFRWRASSR